MKKFLLLFAFAISALCGYAQTEKSMEIVFKTAASDPSTDISSSATVTALVEAGTEYVSGFSGISKAYGPSTKGIKMSSSKAAGAITIGLTDAAKVNATKIVVVASQYGSNNCSLAVNGSAAQSFTGENTELTFPQNPGSILTSIKLDATKRLYVSSITIYYTASGTTTERVATPAISFDESNGQVSIACATEGASISYTLDGGDATAYTAPFTVAYGKHTVTATATKAGMDESFTATSDINYVDPNAKVTIAEFLKAADASTSTTINVPVTVAYRSGNYMYVTDGSDYLLAFGSNNGAAKTGDVLASITGTYALYAGAPQMATSTIGAVTARGVTVEPNAFSIADAKTTQLNSYVKLTGVDINATAKTMTQGTNTIALYNRFNITIEDGKNFTVTGILTSYNGTLQIQPISIAGGEETPSVEGLAIAIADRAVTISCATEGATITYNVNGGEELTYTAPFELEGYGDFTVTATATAEGYLPATATANASFEDPNGGDDMFRTVTFDFINETYGMTRLSGATQDYNEDGTVITNGTVTATLNGKTRLWADGLRMYKNSSIILSVPNNGITITKVEVLSSTDKVLTGTSLKIGTKDTLPAEKATYSCSVSSGNWALPKLVVTYEIPTSLEDVTVEGANAPAEYFNLQGRRIAQPAAGQIYIKRQGTKATKIIF